MEVSPGIMVTKISTYFLRECHNHPRTLHPHTPAELLAIPCQERFNFAQNAQFRETHENSLIPDLSSASASTLNVFILSSGTPCRSRTCTTARENPHSGRAGVPFMNNTTGVDSMAFWIVERASCERKRRATSRLDNSVLGAVERRTCT
jgi:hypothetical protein